MSELAEAVERMKEAFTQIGEALNKVLEKIIDEFNNIIPDLTKSLKEIDKEFEKINANQDVKAHKPKYAKGESYYKNQRKPTARKIYRIQKRG